MDALKQFISSKRLKQMPIIDGQSNHSTGTVHNGAYLLDSSSAPSTNFESTGIMSDRDASALFSNEDARSVPGGSIGDLITGKGDFSADLILSEYDQQVLFQYLRELGEPCTLFGEGDADRLIRSRQMPLNEPRKIPKPKIEGSEIGILRSSIAFVDWSAQTWTNECSSQSIGSIRLWFKENLQAWERELSILLENLVSGDVPKDISRQAALYEETRDIIGAYIQQWVDGQFDTPFINSILNIAEAAREGNLKLANEKYMEVSIGNVAWPIGVGNWGIQERAANDKISKTGHVLNDENIRKFIQAIKRLLTRLQ